MRSSSSMWRQGAHCFRLAGMAALLVAVAFAAAAAAAASADGLTHGSLGRPAADGFGGSRAAARGGLLPPAQQARQLGRRALESKPYDTCVCVFDFDETLRVISSDGKDHDVPAADSKGIVAKCKERGWGIGIASANDNVAKLTKVLSKRIDPSTFTDEFFNSSAFQYHWYNKTVSLDAIAKYYDTQPQCMVLFDDLEHNRKYADALDVTFWHVPNNTGIRWKDYSEATSFLQDKKCWCAKPEDRSYSAFSRAPPDRNFTGRDRYGRPLLVNDTTAAVRDMPPSDRDAGDTTTIGGVIVPGGNYVDTTGGGLGGGAVLVAGEVPYGEDGLEVPVEDALAVGELPYGTAGAGGGGGGGAAAVPGAGDVVAVPGAAGAVVVDGGSAAGAGTGAGVGGAATAAGAGAVPEVPAGGAGAASAAGEPSGVSAVGLPAAQQGIATLVAQPVSGAVAPGDMSGAVSAAAPATAAATTSAPAPGAVGAGQNASTSVPQSQVNGTAGPAAATPVPAAAAAPAASNATGSANAAAGNASAAAAPNVTSALRGGAANATGEGAAGSVAAAAADTAGTQWVLDPATGLYVHTNEAGLGAGAPASPGAGAAAAGGDGGAGGGVQQPTKAGAVGPSGAAVQDGRQGAAGVSEAVVSSQQGPRFRK